MRKKLEKHKIQVQNAVEIGKILRKVRKNKNMTQETIAGLSNMGNRFIVDLEAGKPTMQIDKILKVLQRIGIKVNLEYITLEDENE